MGYGGIPRVSRAFGLSPVTPTKGVRESHTAPLASGRRRRTGAGRRRLTARDPGLSSALDGLVEPLACGDPASPLQCTCRLAGWTRPTPEPADGEGDRARVCRAERPLAGTPPSRRAGASTPVGVSGCRRPGYGTPLLTIAAGPVASGLASPSRRPPMPRFRTTAGTTGLPQLRQDTWCTRCRTGTAP